MRHRCAEFRPPGRAMEHDVTEAVTRLVFQLGIVLIAAKVGGEVAERWLKVPAVLGELGAGIIIGPYALGGMRIFGIGPLFEAATLGSAVPVPLELYAIAQIAAVVLLFVAGLETDVRLFLRYAAPGTAVAVGGVLLPFLFGVAATVAFAPTLLGGPISWGDPRALFMGATMTATSVGITARVLSDLRRLDTAEGVTVLAAAVLDDVIGILVLTVVVGISVAGTVSAGEVAVVGARALGFWLALTGVGLAVAGLVARALGAFRVSGAGVALALALALLAAGLAESFGLAMIIGAYSVGLALSRTDLLRTLESHLLGLYHALVPVFFAVMGMLVDVRALGGALVFGVVVTALAIVGKVVGCGLPALGAGFNRRGAWRIGIGMLPRGEVALIVAGVGLTRGVIQEGLFGVAILMTIVTTVLAPILLVPAFRHGASGRREKAPAAPGEAEPGPDLPR